MLIVHLDNPADTVRFSQAMINAPGFHYHSRSMRMNGGGFRYLYDGGYIDEHPTYHVWHIENPAAELVAMANLPHTATILEGEPHADVRKT